MFVREHVRRVEVGIESGREEIEGEDTISGPEIEGRFEGCGKADGEAIAGADSARWSDGFRASGMVYPSASTCALSTHQAVFCSPLLAPMLCIDGVSDAGTLCKHPRLRWCAIQCPAGLPWPSFTMAAVGRMAASKWRLSACSGCTCPGFSRTSSTSSWSTTILNQARVYRRHKVHGSRQGSNPATLLPSRPPHGQVLNGPSPNLTGRSDCRRHRRQRLKLDGRRP